ncbi:MAG TPA: T9SS type A sorting domain-containing protein [Flavobacteriales bacterium]|mgnify:CR=1 FL=1|nr:T9SS type A sorting domain-containing protein [Flavobacteriales bacterium]
MPSAKLFLPAILIALLVGAPAHAQNLLRGHAFPDVCNGFIIFDPPLSGNPVWIPSNGVTQVNAGYVTFENPGTYELWEDVDGEMVFVDEYTIQSNGWELDVSMVNTFAGVMVSGSVGIRYCGGISPFNIPCCSPDEAQTELLFYQDGEPMDMSGMGCPIPNCTVTCMEGQNFIYHWLDYGHEYQVAINDPVCAGLVLSPITVAHSCANLDVVTEVVSSTQGQANGSITMVEAIPDPNEPFPITAPVIGDALLISLADPNDPTPVEMFEGVGSAIWTGLETGFYILSFSPDQICQPYSDTIFVDLSVGMDGHGSDPRMRIFPTVVEQALFFMAEDGQPSNIDIRDVQGRMVMHAAVTPGPVQVEQLPQGMYTVDLRQGDRLLRTRFIKQ